MPENQIDYIEFSATDLPATQAFYETAFGWMFTDYGPDYKAFTDGRMNGGFTKGEAGTARYPLIVLYRAALEAAETQVKAAGGKIAREIFPFPGGRRFHFTDPSGNELAVWSDK